MRRKGIALVATLAVTLFIAVLVFGAFFTTQLEIWTTRNDTTANQAFAVAQAGIQKYKTLAFQAFRYYLENTDTYGSELARYAQCGNMLVIGLDLNRDGTIDSANDLGNGNSRTEEVTFPDGSKGKYTVSFSASGSYVTLRSVGEYAGAKSTVTACGKGQFQRALLQRHRHGAGIGRDEREHGGVGLGVHQRQQPHRLRDRQLRGFQDAQLLHPRPAGQHL